MSRYPVVAVDGPAGSGKSTVARQAAATFGLHFLDTGLLYRAVGKALLDQGLDPGDQETAVAMAGELQPSHVSAQGLGEEAVGQAASKVAAMPAVRHALLPFQRSFAERPPGAVLAGRDIGSVIFPDADLKLFLTASVEERARRRYEELRSRGEAPMYARVLDELKERDRRDEQRAIAPLVVVEDAVVVDTTELDADAAFGLVRSLIGRLLSERNA